MQIHEITIKKVTEASVAGAVGGTAAVLGGIGSALGKNLMTKALGTDVTSQYGDAQNREQGFQNMVNSPAAKTLGATMQSAWQQTVQNFLANSKDSNGNPPTNLSQVTQPSIATLKANLEDLVNRMIGKSGVDYKNLATYVGDPLQKQYTEKIVTDIDKSVDAIYKATLQNTDEKAAANLFTTLVGMGVLPAQNIMAYDTGRKGSGTTKTGSVPLTPQAQKIADQAKLTDADVLNLQQLSQNPANHAALLQLIGIKST